MLGDVLAYLRCPICGGDLTAAAGALRCPGGHAYDIARQGYANLLTGRAHTGTADTATMVAARARFLGAGHYAPLADLVAEAAGAAPVGGCVLDAGAGTGYYLREVLARQPSRTGLALDISKYALRRAARAHPRIGAVVWDVWRPLPVRDGAASAVIDVFAPRNGAEFHRVLRPGGVLVVVTPRPGHLAELVKSLGLLSVDDRKRERVGRSLGVDRFGLAGMNSLDIPLALSHAEVASLVAMGPSAWHTDPGQVRARISGLAEPIEVTASFEIAAFDARPGS